MIKKAIRLFTLAILFSAGVYAQSVQDGMKAYFSGRTVAAMDILSKSATNPEGAYWLSQLYLDDDEKAQAQQVITSALAANPNNPLLLVAKGQILLTDKRVAEAQQNFDAAIAASKGKKGDEPVVLNAIGRAIVTVFNNVDKVGDINYAVQKLEQARDIVNGMKAKDRDSWLLADIYTNLGDAYRKAKPGEGSQAFDSYQNALTVNPNFAQAEFRKALIFKSQRNYDFYEESLNKAIADDPGFLPAYYELYYYKLGLKDYNSAKNYAEKIKQYSPNDPNNEYFNAQTLYLNKQYDQAINTANALVSKAGDRANSKVYKLIAYSYLDKKDTAAAIPYVDKYFEKVKKAEIVPQDYTLKAMAYSASPGKEQVIYQAYLDGAKADTSLANKTDLLEEGAKFFGSKGLYSQQAGLFNELLNIKPNPTINDYWNAGYAYYKASKYEDSWKVYDVIRNKFNTMNYGYLFTHLNSKIFDSTNAKNIAVPDAEKLIAYSKTDTSKDATKNIFTASWFLANYYNDVAKDKAKAIEYLKVSKDAIEDPAAKESIQSSIESLQKSMVKPKGGR